MPGHTPHPRAVLAAVVALLALVVLAGLFPEADPPVKLPALTGGYADELLVEAPAKAHEARNWALFGEWHRNPADQYQFWRVQAPLWVYPLAGAFKAFGVSYTTLRFFSIAHAILGFVAFAVLALRRLPAMAAAASCWLLASNLFFTQLARSALVEVAFNAWLTWMVVFLWAGPRHPAWLVASQLAFAASFFTKSGALYLFPLLVIANVLTFRDWGREGAFTKLRWLPVVSAVVIAAVSLAYVLQPEYRRVLEWNVGHLVLGLDEEVDSGLRRGDPNRIYYNGFLMMPGVGLLAVPGALWLCWRVWATRAEDRWEALVAGWIVCGWLTLMASRLWTYRYATVVLPPSYLVVGWALAHFWSLGGVAQAREVGLRVWVAASVAFTLLVQGGHQGRWFYNLDWGLHDCDGYIEKIVGDRPAVIVGRFAMPALLATPYDLFYVKPGFNTDPERVNALKVTHGLLERNDIVAPFLVEADRRFTQGDLQITCRIAGEKVELFAYPDKARPMTMLKKGNADPPADVTTDAFRLEP
jgi:hypothetical protein